MQIRAGIYSNLISCVTCWLLPHMECVHYQHYWVW